MNSDYFEAEASQHDEAFKELKSLRSALLEQKHFNSTLKHQLRRATKIQFKLQMTLNIMEEQLQEKFDEVAAKRKKMDTTNVTTSELVGHTRRQRQYDDRIIGEIQVISSDDEEPEPLQHVNPNRKRKSGASGSEAHAVEVEQGHQRNDSAEGALNVEQNHQLAQIEAQVLTPLITYKDNSTQTEDELWLKKHQTGEKKVKCGNQVRSFVRQHQRFHSNEKQFICSECNVEFGDNSSLIKHRSIHYAERPFKCVSCNVGFHQKQHLIRHSVIHTGEKPFVCDVCKRSFTRKDSLSKHKKTHSGKKFSRARKTVSQ